MYETKDQTVYSANKDQDITPQQNTTVRMITFFDSPTFRLTVYVPTTYSLQTASVRQFQEAPKTKQQNESTLGGC